MAFPLPHPCALERRRAVAALALAAELPVVHVVLRMARGAVACELHGLRRLLVTPLARGAGVRAEQRESSRLRMVELPEAPAGR